MRIAVIADIHGNYQALESVLGDIDNLKITTIFSLGDNIGYGPEPERVVRTLIDRHIDSVLGNHELALFNKRYLKKLNFVTRDSLALTRHMLSPESLEWLKKLKYFKVIQGARMVHGCPPDSVTTYLFHPGSRRLEAIFDSFKEQLCFAGHTHSLDCFTKQAKGKTTRRMLDGSPLQFDGSDRYIIIPGSVGQPRDQLSDKAKYGIWNTDESSFTLREIAYDVDTTIELLTRTGFPSSNAIRLKWQHK